MQRNLFSTLSYTTSAHHIRLFVSINLSVESAPPLVDRETCGQWRAPYEHVKLVRLPFVPRISLPIYPPISHSGSPFWSLPRRDDLIPLTDLNFVCKVFASPHIGARGL